MSPSSSSPILGLVTIGQSPRDDVLPQMLPHLPGDLLIRQAGALDGLTGEELAHLRPGPEDYVLHTRLRDGCAVTVGREGIVGLVQDCIHQLEQEGADAVLLLCTGEFPGLRSQVLLIELDRLLVRTVCGLGPRRMGLVVPLASQVEALAEKWKVIGAEVVYAVASPYRHLAEMEEVTRELQGSSVDLVMLDCVGYTETHRQLVVGSLGGPVLLAAALAARVLGELMHR